MSAFQSIKQGLSEAVAHAKGKPSRVKVYRPVAVLRKRLGLTQEQFAARFRFSS
jgi:putative transcriptional regulator